MDSKTTELFYTFDLADFRFFLLLAKKNIKFILFASALVSLIVFLISLNIEKKYLSEATIVIEPDENKIVDINEAYSTINASNRVNNLIAILKSDEVISHIADDEKNQLEFKSLYSKVEKNIFSRIMTKKIIIDKAYIKSILSSNFNAKNIEATMPATKPQNTAGRLFLALTLSKYTKTRTAISIASNPSLRRMKNELKKGVKEFSIIALICINSSYRCQ